jgi:hypothetical protein
MTVDLRTGPPSGAVRVRSHRGTTDAPLRTASSMASITRTSARPARLAGQFGQF